MILRLLMAPKEIVMGDTLPRGRPSASKLGRPKRSGHIIHVRFPNDLLRALHDWVDRHHSLYRDRPSYQRLEYADLIRISLEEFLLARLPENNYVNVINL